MKQCNKLIMVIILVTIAIMLSLLYVYNHKEVEFKPVYLIDTHRLDSLQHKIDSIQINYNKLKEQSNNEKINYITIRDSVIRLNDTLKQIYITNYISQYKSFQY